MSIAGTSSARPATHTRRGSASLNPASDRRTIALIMASQPAAASGDERPGRRGYADIDGWKNRWRLSQPVAYQRNGRHGWSVMFREWNNPIAAQESGSGGPWHAYVLRVPAGSIGLDESSCYAVLAALEHVRSLAIGQRSLSASFPCRDR